VNLVIVAKEACVSIDIESLKAQNLCIRTDGDPLISATSKSAAMSLHEFHCCYSPLYFRPTSNTRVLPVY